MRAQVWNQKVVKGFSVPVNLQNSLLYFFGVQIAFASYLFTPSKDPSATFFTGYTPLAILLVRVQAVDRAPPAMHARARTRAPPLMCMACASHARRCSSRPSTASR